MQFSLVILLVACDLGQDIEKGLNPKAQAHFGEHGGVLLQELQNE